MSEGGWSADEGGAIGRELSDGLRWEIRKDGDVDGNFVVEETNAAANRGAIVGGGSVDKAQAGSDIGGFGGDAVVIEADAEIEDQARVNLPAILDEEGQIVVAGGGGKEAVVIDDSAAEGGVFAKNIDGEVGKEAPVGGTREGISEGEEMTPVKYMRAEVEILRPLIEPGVAALGVEVGARVFFGEKGHFAGGRSRKNLSVETFHGEERGKIAAVRENPAFRGGSKESTLAVTGGDGLRIKGVNVGVLCVLRIDREHYGEVMIGGDVPIDLRVGVSALVDADVVGIGKRGDTGEVVTKVERLEEEEFVAKDGPGESEMRRRAFDAVHLVIDPTEAGDGVFE